MREIEVHLHGGMDVASACRTAGISDKTYYGWRKRYGGIGRAKLSEFKALEKENHWLKKILAELELDKLDPPPLQWSARIVRKRRIRGSSLSRSFEKLLSFNRPL